VNWSLHKLDLESTGIVGDSGAAAFAAALNVNSSLQELYLGSNDIGDSGATAIAAALRVNSSLQKLDLSYNTIGNSGTVAVARALMRHSTLRQLDLRGNRIGADGVAAITESIESAFLGHMQNLSCHFPDVLLEGRKSRARPRERWEPTRKHCFLIALSEGFRSFVKNDLPPALWPHVLARICTFPTFLSHLLLLRSGFLLIERSTGKRLNID
jgi:hypothetical protein